MSQPSNASSFFCKPPVLTRSVVTHQPLPCDPPSSIQGKMTSFYQDQDVKQLPLDLSQLCVTIDDKSVTSKKVRFNSCNY